MVAKKAEQLARANELANSGRARNTRGNMPHVRPRYRIIYISRYAARITVKFKVRMEHLHARAQPINANDHAEPRSETFLANYAHVRNTFVPIISQFVGTLFSHVPLNRTDI